MIHDLLSALLFLLNRLFSYLKGTFENSLHLAPALTSHNLLLLMKPHLHKIKIVIGYDNQHCDKVSPMLFTDIFALCISSTYFNILCVCFHTIC